MIGDAKSFVFGQPLLTEFKKCMNVVLLGKGVECNEQLLESIGTQFSDKIFNARVNEFFKAKKELDLEDNHKVVDCDQSLRDTDP